MPLIRLPILGVAVFLSGCMSSQDSVYLARIDAAQAEVDLLNSKHTTAGINMPPSGTATFKGHASMLVDTAPEQVALIGDVDLTADYGLETISGTADNFFGTGRYLSDDVVNYAGELALEDGDIKVVGNNDFTLKYRGTLTGNGLTIRSNGDLAGEFRGNPIVGVVAGSTNTAGTTVNGVPTEAILAITGIKQ